MKNFIVILGIAMLITGMIYPQVIKGKLIDENGSPLSDINLALYISSSIYSDTSNHDGTFSFEITTGIENNKLPEDYFVSDNFPNPFNPKTRIIISLPGQGNAKIEVFNLLGQLVTDVLEKTCNAGINYVDLELNGLPNGIYISRITVDNKYTIVKKMLLLYGSQHLSEIVGNYNYPLLKASYKNHETILDSLVASNSIIGKKTFCNFPNHVGGTLDLGNLTIERYCNGVPLVAFKGGTYNTVLIGNQCWLKENLNVGAMINAFTTVQSNNGIIEKFCYNNDPELCDIYGGLYQWEEAMQYSQIIGDRGICPAGWHLPTSNDFSTLKTSVNNSSYNLKNIGIGNGNNKSGFSALLSGTFHFADKFIRLDTETYFQSSTFSNSSGSLLCYYMQLEATNGDITINVYGKLSGHSVRCIKNNEHYIGLLTPNGLENWSSGTVQNITWNCDYSADLKIEYSIDNGNTWILIASGIPSSIGNYSWNIPSTPSQTCKVKISDQNNSNRFDISDDFFTIPFISCPSIPAITYAGKTYSTILIGTQCWLKENLNIGTLILGNQSATNNGVIEKYCYNNDSINCEIYGGLYSWEEALQYSYAQGSQGICPTDWHIPTLIDFEALKIFVNNDANKLKEVGIGTGAGIGTNTSGFSALLSGGRSGNSTFININNYGYFWSSTEYDSLKAYNMHFSSNNSDINLLSVSKDFAFSIRCIKD